MLNKIGTLAKRFKDFIMPVIIIGLIIALSVTKCQNQNLKDDVKAPFDSTAIYKARLATLQAEAAKKVILSHLDSVRTAKELRAQSSEIKKLKKAIIPVRRSIQPLVDTVAIVAEYVVLTDSLISAIQAQNDTLSAEKTRIWRALSGINFNKDQQIQLLTELVNHKEVISQDLRKKLRKERRKKTFFKVTTALGIVGVLYMSVKD